MTPLQASKALNPPTPIFNIDESPEIYAQTFEVAAKAAQVKFEGQCKALRLDPKAYEVRTWEIAEEQQHGKILSIGNAPVAKAVGAEPGKAILEMTVNFAYGLGDPKSP